MKRITDKERLDWLGKNEASFIMVIPGLWWVLKKTIAPMLLWLDRDYIDAAVRASKEVSK